MKNAKLESGDYILLKTSYIPLMDSLGTCCENCGKVIANIATIQNTKSTNIFVVGLDCAKTLLKEETYNKAANEIKEKTRISKKIELLKKQGKPYELDESGIPCYPPNTRNGYWIPY